MDPGSSNVAISIIYFVLWAFLTSTYGLCLRSIHSNQELWKMPCYKLMMSIGICDIVQVFGIGFVTAVFSLFQVDGCGSAARLFGTFSFSFWFCGSMLSVVLAFNRFVTVSSQYHAALLFSKRRVYVWILCCFAYGFSFVIGSYSSGAEVFFYSDTYMWFFGNSTASINSETFAMVSDGSVVVAVLIFTFGLLLQLWTKVKAAPAQHHFRGEEKRALIPATSILATFTFIELYFYVSPNISTDWWTLFFTNMQWMVFVGLNGLLIILFNRSVKCQAMLILRLSIKKPHAKRRANAIVPKFVARDGFQRNLPPNLSNSGAASATGVDPATHLVRGRP